MARAAASTIEVAVASENTGSLWDLALSLLFAAGTIKERPVALIKRSLRNLIAQQTNSNSSRGDEEHQGEPCSSRLLPKSNKSIDEKPLKNHGSADFVLLIINFHKIIFYHVKRLGVSLRGCIPVVLSTIRSSMLADLSPLSASKTVLIVATMNRCDRHFVISVVGNPERRLTILIERRGERQLWGQNRKRGGPSWTSAERRLCSLMGQGRRLDVSDIDACGCLRSLRAHVALDGVL